MVRKALAIPAGLAVVFLVVLVLQNVAASFHPLPAGLDPASPEDAQAFTDHLESMPAVSWLLGFASELLGGFLGALTAAWVAGAGQRIFSGVVIGLTLVGSVVNWTAFEHPAWFIGGQLLAYPLLLAAAWVLLAGRDEAVMAT